jgi:hypothetical protein
MNEKRWKRIHEGIEKMIDARCHGKGRNLKSREVVA